MKGIGTVKSDNGFYYTAIQDTIGISRAVRGSVSDMGVEMVYSEIPLDLDYFFGEPFLFDGSIIYPGWTRNYGAGAADATIFMFGEGGNFIGAPTFGGELDEFLYSGIANEDGSIVCVGSYTSFSEGIEQIGVIKLSAVDGGDYIKTFDYSGDCLSYLVVDELDSISPCGKTVHENYYDLFGREVENDRMKSYPGLGESMLQTGIYLKVATDSKGCKTIQKFLVQGK